MSRIECPRLWEAEAIDDGRLGGKERASFERHATTCEGCAGAMDTVTCLRAMAEKLPEPAPLGELEHRRQRAALLRRANDVTVATPRRVAPRAVGVAAALCAAAALAATGGLVLRHRPAPAPVAAATTPATPVFAVSPLPGSSWSTLHAGADVRLGLDSGTLAVHVAKLGPHQHFVIALPDGELEVRGTRFTVSVAGSHTRAVVVTEGLVALRLHGAPLQLVAAGQSWRATPEAPASSTEAAPAAVAAATPSPDANARSASGPLATPARPTPAAARSVALAPESAPPARAAASAAPAASPKVDTAALDLGAAMAAFNAGDFARAEQLLAAFQKHHPGDARCEDAAYLRSVARARAGDSQGAADLARAYLDRYPGGLRRSEAEKLAK